MFRLAGATLVVLVIWVQLVWAQVTTGTISGTVQDGSGAAVPGASVAVRNVDTGVSRTLSTDAQGQYRAPNLSLGRYEVQASLTGFQTAVRSGISLSVGQEAVVNFTLEVGQITERVEVTGEAPLVEATRSDVSGVIEQGQVEDLPLNGRSFLQLAQLQPGVVAARNASSLSYGGQQTTIAFSGSQAVSSLFLLDGTDISDNQFGQTPGGASGLAVGLEMIREFRVLTNSFSAEYGRSAGGVISVVSKAGTNQLQGTAFWFHRNDNMDARNFFDGIKPEFRRNQWGGTVGGPIIKDKTFFLGSYEGLREALGQTSVSLVPNLRAREGFVPSPGGGETNVGVAPSVKPFLNLFPLPTGRDFGNGTAEARSPGSQPTREDFFSARIDHVFSEKDTLFGRYTFRDGLTSIPFGSTPVPGFPGVGNQRQQYITVEETHVFSPSVLNTARGAFNRNRKANPTVPPPNELCTSLFPTCTGQGQLRVGGLDQIGHRISRPGFPTTNVFQGQDSLYLTRGRHSLKVGTDIVRFQSNFNYPANGNGDYSFANLTTFLQGQPQSYIGLLPGSSGYRGWRSTTYGFYVQDEWAMFSNFTLNLGLRYDIYGNISEVNDKLALLLDPWKDTQVTHVKALFQENPGTKLFQPRVGFAWDPFRNGKLAIRGGFGVFFDRFITNHLNGLHQNPPLAQSVTITNPAFPRALAGGATFAPSLASLATPSFSNSHYPYALQWNFTVQQEIVPSTVVSATYAGSHGVHVITQGEFNLNKWEFRDGRKFFPRTRDHLNPAFSSLRDMKTPQGSARFDSLQLNLKRRMSQGLQFQAAYTWSKNIDDGSTFGAAPWGNSSQNLPDIFDSKLGRGLGDLDVRHNFVFNTSYELPFAKANRWLGGWQLGGVMTVASGIPFSTYLSFSRSRSIDGGPDNSAPNRVGPVKIDSRNVDRYFDLSAFVLPAEGFFGNGGRNSIVGPGLATVDFSVLKTFRITERVNFQWRAEMFNLFNRANFATPADSGSGFAKSNVFTSASGIANPSAAKLVRTVTSPRQIQMGLKINF